MPEILHKLLIKRQPEGVYEGDSQHRMVWPPWRTRDCVAVPKEGSVPEFYFNNISDSGMMKITKLEKDTRVSWVCIDGVDEWKGTTILFKLSTHTKGSILFFSHNEWKSIERIFPNCNFDWARYLLSLKKYCEMGIGEPHLG